jgi:hypothetical protein
MSHTKVGRVERGDYPSLQVVEIAVLLAIAGRRLSARAHPHGSPARDRAHQELLFRSVLHSSLTWRTEVPLPSAGALRAWDAVTRMGRGVPVSRRRRGLAMGRTCNAASPSSVAMGASM